MNSASESIPDPLATEYDVIVLGAGPAGENIVGPVTAAGLTCAVVESGLAGGECSYFACIPSKALLRPLEVRAAARGLDGLGEPALDVGRVLSTRDAAVNHLDDSNQAQWIERQPATLVRGRGRVAGTRLVDVESPEGPGGPGGTVRLRARHAVVVATGTDPTIPPIDGIEQVPVWTNRDALSAPAIPDRLVVLGGGVVAVELGQAMSGLGAQVTLLVRGHAVLGRMEPFAGTAVLEQFERDGIDVRLGVSVERVEPVERSGGPGVRVVLESGDAIEADRLLLGTGRTPRTAGLGLERYGVADGQAIAVDDLLTVDTSHPDDTTDPPDATDAPASTDPWLYAVGDVNGRSSITHMGKYQARICAQVIIDRARGESPDPAGAYADGLGAPQVVFTDPQCGAVGRTAAQAREDGIEIDVVSVGFDSVAASSLHGWQGRGTAQLVIDHDRQVVIGATFVGPEVAELVHAATIAIVGRVPIATLWHTVPTFPTISEIWLRLLESYAG